MTLMHLNFAERAIVLAITLTGLTLGTPAHAEPNRVLAETLFQQGRELMDQGKFAEACAKFNGSLRAERSTGTMLNLALCHSEQGKTATAWGNYKTAASLARAGGDSRRENVALRRAEELEPKLNTLRITVSDPVEGISVLLGDAKLDPASYGLAVPVDPGEHGIRATAPQHADYQSTIKVEGEGQQIEFVIPALEKQGAPPPPVAAPTPAPITSPLLAPTTAPQPDRKDGLGLQRTIGIVVGVAGVVGLGIGTGLGVSVLNTTSDVRDDPNLCQETGNELSCNQSAIDTIDDARPLATGANIGLIAGGIAFATGVVVVLLAPSDDDFESAQKAANAWQLQPFATPEGAGALIGGTF